MITFFGDDAFNSKEVGGGPLSLALSDDEAVTLFGIPTIYPTDMVLTNALKIRVRYLSQYINVIKIFSRFS